MGVADSDGVYAGTCAVTPRWLSGAIHKKNWMSLDPPSGKSRYAKMTLPISAPVQVGASM
jgi:hypothetical protein